MIGDQADGLRRLFGATAMTLEVAARDLDVIDAYVRIKHFVFEKNCGHFRIAITHARSAAEAQSVFDNLQRVAHEYLGMVRLEYLGMAAAEAEGAASNGKGRPRRSASSHNSVL